MAFQNKRSYWVKQTNKKLIDIENSMVITRGEETKGAKKGGEGGINGDGRRLDIGW